MGVWTSSGFRAEEGPVRAATYRSQYPFRVLRREGLTNTLMAERLGSRCGSVDLLGWPWSGAIKVLDTERNEATWLLKS